MIHVIRVLGQADWIDRTTANVWQQSPMAESLITQTASGAVLDPCAGDEVAMVGLHGLTSMGLARSH
jgi:hypothetical protein